MTFWRRPAAHQVDVPAPRGGDELADGGDLGPTEGEIAREAAEKALSEEMKRTEAVKEQTEVVERLGHRLDRIYATNHIREDVVGVLLNAIRGGA